MGIRSYYNYALIMSLNAMMNFIIGGRGLGKTWGIKRKAINNAIRKGHQFVYMRRFDNETIESKSTFFADIAHLWPKYDFRVNGGVAEFTKAITQRNDETDAQFDKRMRQRKWEIMCHFVTLGITQNLKGKSFPKVRMLIFDEFIIERGNRQYLPDEARIFLNVYNTFDRWEDRVRVFFLANSVSIMNPYFIKWKIRPDESGALIVKNGGYVAAHFPDSEDFKKEVFATAFGKFIAEVDEEYADYAVGNQFSDNNDQLVKPKHEDAKYIFTLETLNGTFSVWTVPTKDGTEYYASSKRPRGNERLRTLVPTKVSETNLLVKFNDMPLATLRTAWRQGRVWFDDQNTRNTFADIFTRS